MSIVISLTKKQHDWLKDLLENTNPGYESAPEKVDILSKLVPKAKNQIFIGADV